MVELSLIKSLLTGIPYYGPALRADFDADGKEALRAIFNELRSIKSGPKVLEVGCWLGATTAQLTAHLDQLFSVWDLKCIEDFHPPIECATHFPVESDAIIDLYSKASDTGVLSGLLEHNLKQNKQCSRINILQKPILEALQDFDEHSFDLVIVHSLRALTQFGKIMDQCTRICTTDGILCGTALILQRDEVDTNSLEYCLRFPNRSFYAYDEKTKIQYYPEVSHELAVRFGHIPTNNGFWAVKLTQNNHSTPITLPSPHSGPSRHDATQQYQVIQLNGDRYAILHDSVPVSLLGNERLGAREIPDILEFCATHEQAIAKMQNLEERRRRQKGVWLDTTDHYYLVKFGANTYMAQSKYLNVPRGIQFFSTRLGEHELEPLLLLGNSIGELKQKVAIHEAGIAAHKKGLPVQERYHGYYLYEAHNDYWVAVRMDVTRGRPFQNLLGEEDLAPYVLTASTLRLLRARIEQTGQWSDKKNIAHDQPECWL